ncbi:hypothetical protein ACNQFZ_13095 [Schinkia sp. CFF1]
MKKPNKLKTYALTGVLTLGVIGAAAAPTFAAANTNGTAATGTHGLKVKWEQNLDVATKEKIQTIMDDAKAKLAELGVTLPTKFEKGDQLANLDEATKAKVKVIRDQVKAGTLTEEAAQEELSKLGLNLPVLGKFHQDPFQNLDATVKEKVKAIMDKVKDGSLSRDDAKTQLAQLGVELPERAGGLHGAAFDKLDDATKAKIQAIMDKVKDGSLSRDDAKTQLAQLGVDLPERAGGLHGAAFDKLDDATKAKVQAIMDKVKDGSLSRDDAKTQLDQLGVNLPERAGGLHGAAFDKLDDATKAKVQEILKDAKEQIKELTQK